MSRICAYCGKGPRAQSKRKLLRGHYNPTTRRIKRPNLQRVNLPPELMAKWNLPQDKRARLCAKCIKSSAKLVPVK